MSENAINADSEESEDEWNYYRMENKCETSNSTNLITKEVSDISDNVNFFNFLNQNCLLLTNFKRFFKNTG